MQLIRNLNNTFKSKYGMMDAFNFDDSFAIPKLIDIIQVVPVDKESQVNND